MERIFFHPLIGSNHFSGDIFGMRNSVLGDSHYCDEDCYENGINFS